MKSPTGILGLDEIITGGLPKGRPTLVCGSAGAGKSLLAMEFLVRGITQFQEPGVLLSFEERPQDIIANVASLGFNLPDLVNRKLLVIDHIRVERSEIEETGEYDLEGLFIRLNHAIQTVGARRVVLDTIETLFSGLSDAGILRAELNRLFQWLKDRNVTTIVTGERGEGTLTRHGLEEYLSDCVILLDHRVVDQISTRRLRVVKYRGTAHGTNEYPFLIDEQGFSVMPVTSVQLSHQVSDERMPSGLESLDQMLGGTGYYRGSSILVAGTPGTGKTSLACTFVDAACARGERCLYYSFEESPHQIMRNMRSIGLDLKRWVDQGLLAFEANRPTLYGLEMHLALMLRRIQQFNATVVVVDPVGNISAAGTLHDAALTLLQMVNHLKAAQITGLFTNLTHGIMGLEETEVGISSLMDTWILMRDLELNGERNRALYVLKSRGMAHSNQVREFLISDRGIELRPVYVGPGGVLTGSSRIAQEAQEELENYRRQQGTQRLQRDLERKRVALDARIASLRVEFEMEEEKLQQMLDSANWAENRMQQDRQNIATVRDRHHGRGNGQDNH